MTPYVSLCYPGYGIAAESVFVRGAYQSGWTWANGGGSCPDTSSHSVSLNLGTNTFSVVACSSAGGGNMGECGDDGANAYYDNVQVTPHGDSIIAGVGFDTLFVFTITNYQSSSGSFNLTTTCSGSGVSNCVNTKGSSVSIGGNSSDPRHSNVSDECDGRSDGDGAGKAVYASNSAGLDSGYVKVTDEWQTFGTVSTAYTKQEDQDYSRCAASCFALITSLGTPPYISRDVAHSVSLIDNGDRLNPRTIVMADVTLDSDAYTASDIQLKVAINTGACCVTLPFRNGDTLLHFSPTLLNAHHGADLSYSRRCIGQRADQQLVPDVHHRECRRF